MKKYVFGIYASFLTIIAFGTWAFMSLVYGDFVLFAAFMMGMVFFVMMALKIAELFLIQEHGKDISGIQQYLDQQKGE